MVFSSSVFLFLFLPVVLVLYFAFKDLDKKNTILLIFSLIFYAWGEPIYIFLLLASIFMNWLFGRLVVKGNSKRKIWLTISVILNVGLLFVFKYLGFAASNLGLLLGSNLSVNIALPIGISFFTFQAMSYVIDVYRGDGVSQKKIRNVALYISLFPQLIAGPIVRYQTVADQITNRTHSLEKIRGGVRRFILGLGKKVIFANNFSLVADAVFYSGQQHGFLILWIGAVAYSLQILFDFSGYSDMAIGLGRIFGFEFLENFDYPYTSKSVTEFWRRWHISLGSWFRDYVYIPLGGNRVSGARHIFNLFIVWLLTGFWHGANWTFVVWGLFYFVILVIEKFTHMDKLFEKKLHILPHIYTMLLVVLGWVIFRADNISAACSYLQGMFGASVMSADDWILVRKYVGEYIGVFVLSFALLIPWNKIFTFKEKYHGFRTVLADIAYLIVFLVSVSYIMKGSYSPFIYFNF
jgi:D-alanyl-lipoteichoic acid acyltransferase DltB (MBOAT superfamily)